LIRSLKDYEANVSVYDPWANAEEVKHEYGLELLSELPTDTFDAVVVAVAHTEFKGLNWDSDIIYKIKLI